MEKALDMGKTSASGSFALLIGVAVSSLIMAVGTIILARLMTTDEYGLYGIILIPPTMMNLFRDWGVNSAMTKYIATYRVTNNEEEIHDVIIAGLIFEIVAGLALSFLSLFLANFIASTIFNRPSSASLIAIISVSIISGSLFAASQSVFVGFERMRLNSFTLICQALVKTAIGPVLVFLGYGVLGGILGYTFGFVAAATIGLAIFYFLLFKPLRKPVNGKSNITKTLRTMLNYGVPLSIYSILSGILVQIYAFMMPSFASDAMIGNYQTAANFSILLTFITIPITTVLFPTFSKLNPHTEHGLLKTIFTSSIKYTSILLVPAAMAIMALSGPMVGTLFGEKYVYGPFFLTLFVAGNLFVVFGNISAGSFLSGLGETRILMKQSILTLVIGLPLGIYLIPIFGIPGLLIANLLSGLPSMVWVLYWIWKHYETKADFNFSFKILAASALSAVVSYLSLIFFSMPDWANLIIGLVIFFIVYLLSAPLIGAVNVADISNLRTMFSGLGVIAKIINVPLKVAEKAAMVKSTRKKIREQSLK